MSKSRSTKVDTQRPWSKRRERIWIAAVCLVGAALRLYLIQFHPFVNYDGSYYINYFRDPAWRGPFSPGYPLFIELFRLFLADGVIAAQTVSLCFGSLMAIRLYSLARRFMNQRAALLATIIVVLNPSLIRWSVLPMSDVQFVFLEILTFLLFLKRYPFFFGLAGGLAYLTRPEALVFTGALIFFDLAKNREWRFTALAFAGLAIFALPYVLYLRIEYGAWSLSPKTMNLREWYSNWRENLKLETHRAPEPSFGERIGA